MTAPLDPLPFHGGEHTVHLSAMTVSREYTFAADDTTGPMVYAVRVRYTGDPHLTLTDEDLAMVPRWINGTLHLRDLSTVLDTPPTLEALATTILSLSLTVLEARAATGYPAPCHTLEVTVRDSTGAAATATAPLPILTTGGPA